LDAGTSYCVSCGCVSCGCTNDAAYEKLIANENRIEERRFWLKLWSSLSNMALFSRLFR
jgi:hypothetical protein